MSIYWIRTHKLPPLKTSWPIVHVLKQLWLLRSLLNKVQPYSLNLWTFKLYNMYHWATTGVTRWQCYFLATHNNSKLPKINKHCNSKFKILPNTKLTLNCLKVWKSGEISPNLVTLATTTLSNNNLDCRYLNWSLIECVFDRNAILKYWWSFKAFVWRPDRWPI